MARRAKHASTPKVGVKSLKHDDAYRKNIPTIENEGLVPDDIKTPTEVDYPRISITMYPRDPDKDPQLVWRGKDLEDANGDLVVRSLPIYVHEHITPQKILESLMDDSSGRDFQYQLFERDFNGLTEEQRLQFYEFDGHWTNRMILGDSLPVMASLSEKEGLRGEVQAIYFDPPYGIQFRSNFQTDTSSTRVKEGNAESLTTEPEQVRAYRDTWKDGIHSFLSYLRDRLTVARDLLSQSGSLFVQIGDANVHLVRSILDEVLGPKNYVAEIIFVKTTGQDQETLNCVNDYILWYARNRESVKYRPLFFKKRDDISKISGLRVQLPNGQRRSVTNEERINPASLPKGSRLFVLDNMTSSGSGGDTRFPFVFDGAEYWPKKGRHWSTHLRGLEALALADRIVKGDKGLSYVRFLEDFEYSQYSNVWTDTQIGGFGDKKVYVVQTNTKVIERCLLMTTDPGDLVLDPTCGSGTTAYCAEQWGRRWITVDTSRVALMVARERLIGATFPYFVLSDSHEGRLRESEKLGTAVAVDGPRPLGRIEQGFVYERAHRVTLGTIANTPGIEPGMTHQQVDTAVRQNSEVIRFVDQPMTNKAFVRVSGPFTVESLAPTEAAPIDQPAFGSDDEQAAFVRLIIENLRISGISNGEKAGKTKFAAVDAYPGSYVNALGVTDDNRRIAIAIGPKDGTIGKAFMRDAAREAVDHALADSLAVCGFAFEDATQTEQVGKLLILKVRMNQDLQIGELLKKSKSANLFRVYGEPDVELIKEAGTQFRVRVHGMDVYDPSSREIRSAGIEKISAWFVDTNYDGERFIVRQVYFLGNEEVFDDLQRALKGEVDKTAWESIHSDTSRPFPMPKTGRVAVKVITIYGDEAIVVLKP